MYSSHRFPPSKPAYPAGGFSVLEVLVAMVVFAVGLLGLASLQVIGQRLSGDTYLRTIATMQVNDIIDRMRANVSATSLGINSPYNNPTATYTANPNCLGWSNSGVVNNSSCTAAQMAGQDFYEWYANLNGAPATSWHNTINGSLPSCGFAVCGIVCIDDSGNNNATPAAPACNNQVLAGASPVFSIQVWWVERKNANAPGTLHTYITRFSL